MKGYGGSDPNKAKESLPFNARLYAAAAELLDLNPSQLLEKQQSLCTVQV